MNRDKMPIPYGRQSISDDDIQAVVDTLRSPFLTQGPKIEEFEQVVAKFCGAKYAVATNSATSALHIACLAAGLREGDHHWTTPNTFVASANCALYCRANVDFVDIEPRTYNLCSTALEKKLTLAANQGRLPKVLVPVAFAGQSASMREIYQACKKFDVAVIEDASHGIGGSYLNSKLGSCTYSDMTIFSFHPVKIITTGEGGMILTNREDLYQKLIRLRSHGITRDVHLMSSQNAGPWYYEQIDLGFNYRMTDIAASLGVSQMDKIEQFVKRRQSLVARYNSRLRGLPLVLPYQSPESDPAWHLYVVKVDTTRSKLSRLELYNRLRERGILCNVHYIPVHLQPFYKKLGFQLGQFPNSEEYYRDALSLPLYFDLTDLQQDRVISELENILK